MLWQNSATVSVSQRQETIILRDRIARARLSKKKKLKSREQTVPSARTSKIKFYCLSPCARDGEVTKNSLSRHEHRTDINTEFRSLSVMVSCQRVFLLGQRSSNIENRSNPFLPSHWIEYCGRNALWDVRSQVHGVVTCTSYDCSAEYSKSGSIYTPCVTR